MKPYAAIAFLLAAWLMLPSARAAPTIVMDVPSTAPDSCVCSFAGQPQIVVPVTVDALLGLPANANRICRISLLAALVPGTNTLTCALQVTGTGTVTSAVGPASVPFSFTLSPPLVVSPSGARLLP